MQATDSESDVEDGKEGGKARDPRTQGPGTPTTGGNRGGGGKGGGGGIAGQDMAEGGGKRKPAPGKDCRATPAKKSKVCASKDAEMEKEKPAKNSQVALGFRL
jgi:hypothetical protein